jgi:AIR synthase-related protein
MTPEELVAALRASRGFGHKTDLAAVLTALGREQPDSGIGDDCAVIPERDGHLLLAIEGFVEDFVQRMPWFAGYCGVMVNVSDVYAMGGRPTAVVDALWSSEAAAAGELLRGLTDAARVYGVPLVGGHSNTRSTRGQLATAILGRAGQHLLSSFAALPGDQLVMAVDLRGRYHDPYPYWDASTNRPAQRLRDDLEILPLLAESRRCDAAKDISMAGCIGTALMLLECSRVGARIDVDAVPRPETVKDDASLLRWLSAFPSYGFILSVRAPQVEHVLRQFRDRNIAANSIGLVTETRRVDLHLGDGAATLWDLGHEPFMAVPVTATARALRPTGS